MAQAKSELFNSELTEQAAFFKALAHPARLQILKFLVESKSCITGDISDKLPLGRTTVNQHIKELKAIGLIHGQVDGAKTNYCLNTEKLATLKAVLNSFLKNFDAPNYPCQ